MKIEAAEQNAISAGRLDISWIFPRVVAVAQRVAAKCSCSGAENMMIRAVVDEFVVLFSEHQPRVRQVNAVAHLDMRSGQGRYGQRDEGRVESAKRNAHTGDSPCAETCTQRTAHSSSSESITSSVGGFRNPVQTWISCGHRRRITCPDTQ